MVVGEGTDVVGSGAIYSYPEPSLIKRFKWSNDRLKWVVPYNFVFNRPDFTGQYRPKGSVEMSSLGVININNGEEETLMQSNETSEYHLWKVEDNFIYYVKTEVPTFSDWFTEKETESYWKLNLDDNEPVQVVRVL